MMALTAKVMEYKSKDVLVQLSWDQDLTIVYCFIFFKFEE